MLSRHVLTVSDFQILVKSCSIESRNDPSPKSEVVHETKFSIKISYSTHAWRQHYFLRHIDANFVQKRQKCQICVIYENHDCVNEDGVNNEQNGGDRPIFSLILMKIRTHLMTVISTDMG